MSIYRILLSNLLPKTILLMRVETATLTVLLFQMLKSFIKSALNSFTFNDIVKELNIELTCGLFKHLVFCLYADD